MCFYYLLLSHFHSISSILPFVLSWDTSSSSSISKRFVNRSQLHCCDRLIMPRKCLNYGCLAATRLNPSPIQDTFRDAITALALDSRQKTCVVTNVTQQKAPELSYDLMPYRAFSHTAVVMLGENLNKTSSSIRIHATRPGTSKQSLVHCRAPGVHHRICALRKHTLAHVRRYFVCCLHSDTWLSRNDLGHKRWQKDIFKRNYTHLTA